MRCSTACLIRVSRLPAPTTALYFRRSDLAAPTCRLAASCPDGLLLVGGASTVGSEGVEVGTVCRGTVATAFGFLAALTCLVADGGAGGLLLGASTVGSEGGVGTTTGSGGAAITPVTTAELACLAGTSWVSWLPRATSRLLLTSSMSLKLQRKSAPRMGNATGSSRKLHRTSWCGCAP